MVVAEVGPSVNPPPYTIAVEPGVATESGVRAAVTGNSDVITPADTVETPPPPYVVEMDTPGLDTTVRVTLEVGTD